MDKYLLYERKRLCWRFRPHKNSNFIFKPTKPFAMNSKILLLALTVAVLSSCTTSYKTGQTPDDVYYSPVKPQEEYVKNETREEEEPKTQSKDDNSYDDRYSEDQYLRMKVRNRYRWSDLDDPYYYSRRYNYSVYNCCCFGNPWTPSSYWNNHFNPYYNSYIIINPKTSLTYTAPRTFNLNSYNNQALTNSNYSNPKVRNTGSGATNNNNNNNNTYTAPRNKNSNESNAGKILREVFKPSNTSSNNNSSTNTNNNSSSGSSSSGSSSGSSTPAPVRRF